MGENLLDVCLLPLFLHIILNTNIYIYIGNQNALRQFNIVDSDVLGQSE